MCYIENRESNVILCFAMQMLEWESDWQRKILTPANFPLQVHPHFSNFYIHANEEIVRKHAFASISCTSNHSHFPTKNDRLAILFYF